MKWYLSSTTEHINQQDSIEILDYLNEEGIYDKSITRVVWVPYYDGATTGYLAHLRSTPIQHGQKEFVHDGE